MEKKYAKYIYSSVDANLYIPLQNIVPKIISPYCKTLVKIMHVVELYVSRGAIKWSGYCV